MTAIKFIAIYLSFIDIQVNHAAAKRGAGCSAHMPYELLDPVERRMVVWLCILAITFASASAWWLLPLFGA